MHNRVISTVPFMLALAVALVASPVDAQQGRGAQNGKAKDKTEVRRDDREERPVLQRRDVEDRDDEWGENEGRARSVPRGWCQGVGNPHNTVENCGYRGANARNGNRSGSYETSHAEFHRYLDDRYRALAAERPLDIRRQLELRAQKSAEHERWHAQAGRAH